MDRKNKKQLIKCVKDFLDILAYFIEDCGEDKQLIEIIVKNEIIRFFKNKDRGGKRWINLNI